MPDDKKLALSRRQLLGGLGAVGAASAGAGLGTTALFSDTESFTGNQITAGTLDLKVAWKETYDYAGASTDLEDTTTKNCGDTTAAAEIDLDDVKPGDSGSVDFDFQICGNPGYLWLFSDLTSASENGVTEPEANPDAEDQASDGSLKTPSTDIDGPTVELLDAVDVTLSYDGGETFFTGSLREFLSRSQKQANLGVFGLPLDGDRNSSYDEAHRAAGAGTSVQSFVESGVNIFNFDPGVGTDIDPTDGFDAVVETAPDPAGGGRGNVAHATSNGTATNDYVTSVVDISSIGWTVGSIDSNDVFRYDYYEGSMNDDTAPDEVYLGLSNGSVVYRTADTGSTETWSTRHVNDEIVNETDWREIMPNSTQSIGNLQATYPNEGIHQVGFGRGFASSDAVLDVYYDDLRVDGNDYEFPTVDTEYTASGREAFAGDTPDSVLLEWSVPDSVGNEIQSDSATFDLGFYAVQDRNNDGSTSA